MPEINYKELDKYLTDPGSKPYASVWLIYGEDLLCKKGFEHITNVLNSGDQKNLNHDIIDNDNVYDAVERVNTYSMFSGNRLVSLIDSKIFYGQEDKKLIEKTRQAFDAEQMEKAAKFLTSLLSLKNLSYDDIEKDRAANLKIDSEYLGDGKWLDSILEFCKDNNIPIKAVQDNTKDLQQAVEKGFPSGNFLIITADIVDKRRILYKAIKEKGVIVDCSVPKGNTRADKIAQNAMLNQQMQAVLSRHGKTMDITAYNALCDMTGFNLRTFENNLDKLVNYTGPRPNITIDDVRSVLKRTCNDPIYELTNAVSERNIEASLFYMDSLLSQGFYPLQILASIIKQARNLLLVKDFIESSAGKAWRTGTSYDQFQKNIMPAIQNRDQMLINQIDSWEQTLSANTSTDENNKNKKKSQVSTDLIIAKNPRSAYPIYLTVQKSEKYTKEKLVLIMEKLGQADIQLKTTGRNPRLVLEEAVFYICRNDL
ncbi:DNA polymerase III N-terminal domain-containing protein [Desulfonema limicola]|uniref:DNA polymerase III subunit delta n=1 Tax=Desulfonema limicola TaxID=45656 RepID=A0A975GGI7_9BACT|nr:hypothetical protein [Desulfonema limicola]QTA80370.1 DNA polymerase III N-terminal domain-containing protein [Desulfonema limicola]